uniref:Uncharacterized protein n=1 Tax=Oryza glumipatula TaxID=40148 RepID=A0A0D9YUA6_9ORYZ
MTKIVRSSVHVVPVTVTTTKIIPANPSARRTGAELDPPHLLTVATDLASPSTCCRAQVRPLVSRREPRHPLVVIAQGASRCQNRRSRPSGGRIRSPRRDSCPSAALERRWEEGMSGEE